MRWAGWLKWIAVAIVALFGLMLVGILGWSYIDVRTAVGKAKNEIETAAREGKAEIESAAREGTKEIASARETIAGLKVQVKQIQSDIDRYRRVNSEIAKLQEEFTKVKDQIVDFGKRRLKAETIETTGPGPGAWSIGVTGCPPSTIQGNLVTYCAQGSPLSLFQVTSTGERRPVASLSAVGFQDVSTAAKPTCTAANRGTFYVEKGTGQVADKPFLCAKTSDNTYGWIQLGMIP